MNKERVLKIYADNQEKGEILRNHLVKLGLADRDCTIELVYGRCLVKPAISTRRRTYEGEMAVGTFITLNEPVL